MIQMFLLAAVVAQVQQAPLKVFVPLISGVGLQTTKAELIKRLGIPDSQQKESYLHEIYEYGDMVRMKYPGLSFRLVNGVNRKGPFRVLEAEVSSKKWVVSPGLSVGMTVDQAKRQIPGLHSVDDPNNPGEIFLLYSYDVKNTQDGGALILDIRRGRVSRIHLTSNLD